LPLVAEDVRVPLLSVMVTGATLYVLTVIGIAVAVSGLAQTWFEVITQEITCPLLYTPVKVEPVPAFTPSTVHT
jgi:hypothetical protein